MKTVSLLYHPKLPQAQALARELAQRLGEMDIHPWLSSAWDEDEVKAQLPGTHAVVTLGGDGTVLRAARLAAPWGLPLVGVNFGRLGFLAEVTPEEALERVPFLLAGGGILEDRTMLQAAIVPAAPAGLGSGSGEAGEEEPLHALNDVVVARGRPGRPIYVQASIDGQLLTTYRADAVIVATATGSTGYALAAGGPILNPTAREMVLAPVSAHLALSNALVLSPDAIVQLTIQTDHQAVLSLDGQRDLELEDGDRVEVRRSPYVARFLRANPSQDFYRTLMQRLR